MFGEVLQSLSSFSPSVISSGALCAGLRIASLAGRFLFVMVIGRYLLPSEVGQIGLIQSSIIFLVLAVGLDFYVFSTREILRPEGPGATTVLRGQLSVQARMWLIMGLLLVLAGKTLGFELSVVFMGLALLLMEHLGQEASRLLFALSMPVRATFVLWLKSGFWPILLALAFITWPEYRRLETVLLIWLTGSSAAVLAGAYYLRPLFLEWNTRERPDKNWIRAGLKISSRYLIASTLFVSLDYLDRFFVYHYVGDAAAGVFTVYFSLANTVKVLTFSGVVSVLYPRLISAFQSGNEVAYRDCQRSLRRSVPLVAIAAAIACLPALWIILEVIDKPDYWSDLPAFLWLLAASIVGALAYIPHYILIAQSQDNQFLLSAAGSAACLVLLDVLMIPSLGLVGAGIAKLSAAIVLLALQVSFALKLQRNVS
jgi:O-antigen/teichoic acid export membrane protein